MISTEILRKRIDTARNIVKIELESPHRLGKTFLIKRYATRSYLHVIVFRKYNGRIVNETTLYVIEAFY